MANYRIERVRIRLSENIEGLDPNANIDPTELCWIDPGSVDANSCGMNPLSNFYAADFPNWREDDKWFPAQDGLTTVRGLLAHHNRTIAQGNDPLGRSMTVIQEKVSLLEELDHVLRAADEAGILFCLAVSD